MTPDAFLALAAAALALASSLVGFGVAWGTTRGAIKANALAIADLAAALRDYPTVRTQVRHLYDETRPRVDTAFERLARLEQATGTDR